MFGAPWWLLGTAAGAAPLIIHLLNKHRFKRVTWAAMEWLLRALERNRRRMRVENIILLIIRTLILVLLALALARPVLRAGALLLGEGSRTARIFVVDTSYSMGVQKDGKTPLETAKRLVMQLLDKARKGDVASLVVTGSESAEAVPDPSSGLQALRDQVAGVGTEGITLSHRDADLADVLTRVATATDKMPHPRIEVYVLTDMQRASWLEEDRIRSRTLKEALERVKDRAGFFVVDCSSDDAVNSAVTRIAVNAEGSDDEQSLVAVGLPMTVRATLNHFGAETREEVGVRLLIDGQTEGEKRVTLEPRKPTVVQFPEVTFKEPGVHVVRIEADEDALKLDDARDLAIDAEQEIKVLCVNGAPSVDPVSNETYYLERALAPQQFAFAEGTSVFSVETVSDVEFLNKDLSAYRLVVLANVFQVPEQKVSAIETFVRAGGGLIVFAGDRLEGNAWNERLYRGGEGCLPAQVLERKVIPAGDDGFVRFDIRDSTHEVVRTLLTRGVDFTASRVYGWFYLKADESDRNVRVLCRYTDKDASPAMVEKTFGQGHVVLIGTSATINWSTFPLTYPPFVQELASYLVRGGAGRRNVTVGEPISAMLFPDEFDSPVRVVNPAGDPTEIAPAPEGDAYRFGFADTRYAGIYTVDFGGSRGRAEYVVRLDTRESDLERADAAELTRAVGTDVLTFVGSADELQAAIRRGDTGSSLWRPVVLAVLALCLLESLLATVFGNRRGLLKKG